MAGLKSSLQKAFACRFDYMEIMNLESMEPELLTPEKVTLLASKNINVSKDHPETICQVYKLDCIQAVFRITNPEVAMALLQSLRGYKDNRRFATNMERLNRLGVFGEEFPLTRVLAGARYNLATLLWMIIFYLQIEGYDQRRGFIRRFGKHESPWPSPPNNAGNSLRHEGLVAIPEDGSNNAGNSLNQGALVAIPENGTKNAGNSLSQGALVAIPENGTENAGNSLNQGALAAIPEDGILNGSAETSTNDVTESKKPARKRQRTQE